VPAQARFIVDGWFDIANAAGNPTILLRITGLVTRFVTLVSRATAMLASDQPRCQFQFK
jgi:hypothetical protein